MKNTIYSLSALFLFSLLIFSGCKSEPGEEPAVWSADGADASGNLLMVNQSGRKLVLYKDGDIIKNIPASSSDYLINIQNSSGGTVELQIYDWDAIKDELDGPSYSNLYKNWQVVLSSSTSLENRVTWHVSADDQYTAISTIDFNYYGGTDNSVDVYINGKNGAKIMSLKPGDQYRSVGLDYGNYTLHYNYWFSDQNNVGNSEDKGWIERQTVMGEESYIWLVTNENRKEQTLIIPHQGAAALQSQLYGSINVTNNTADLLQVYAGGRLIEEVCYLEEGNNQNLSSLASLDSYTYILPIQDVDLGRQNYTLTAKNTISGSVVDSYTFELVADSTVNWSIE